MEQNGGRRIPRAGDAARMAEAAKAELRRADLELAGEFADPADGFGTSSGSRSVPASRSVRSRSVTIGLRATGGAPHMPSASGAHAPAPIALAPTPPAHPGMAGRLRTGIEVLQSLFRGGSERQI